MDTTQSLNVPDWIAAMLAAPEVHDTEHGRSCFYCDSSHGKYDGPLEHWIDCPWLKYATLSGLDLAGHTVYEPTVRPPCEKCGWYYDSPDDWRGRRMWRPECSDEMKVAHDTHIAEEHGITYEEFLAGPHGTGREAFFFDGPMAWHMKWMQEAWLQSLKFPAERGGISYIKGPEL